jgi:hypothetical protein
MTSDSKRNLSAGQELPGRKAARSPDWDHSVGRASGVVDLAAMRNVSAVERGDPEALRAIFLRLVKFLRGEGDLPFEYASFVADALTEFVESRTMKAAGEYYKGLTVAAVDRLWGRIEKRIRAQGGSEKLTDEQIGNRVSLVMCHEGRTETRPPYATSPTSRAARSATAPSLSPAPQLLLRENLPNVRLPARPRKKDVEGWTREPTRAAIGREFCRAFGISPRRGKKESERPYYIRKIRQLLRYGESASGAIDIVRSATDEPKSKRQIYRWLSEEGMPDKDDIRKHEHMRRFLGFMIECWLEEEIALEDVYSGLSEVVVRRIVELPNATCFLQGKTMRAAHDLVRDGSLG